MAGPLLGRRAYVNVALSIAGAAFVVLCGYVIRTRRQRDGVMPSGEWS